MKLRSFDGELVGPTLRLRPGDVLRLMLANNLPKESAQDHVVDDVVTPMPM